MISFDKEYAMLYQQGWDARMADLYVNPFVYDFDSKHYTYWQHGWEDCDLELKVDNDDGSQTI